MAAAETQKKRLVILGTGFAGFSLARDIDTRRYDVVIVSPRNHFLFTPLLPSTTVGTIEFRSIGESIRAACRNATYYQAYCTGIDAERRVILCEGRADRKPFEVPYDVLVIAVGAISNDFGIPGVREHALFLRSLTDARAIRHRILELFERAAQPGLPDSERKRLLHFVVVGGGPTGVEFAAEMHDFLTEDLRKLYASLVPEVSITLLEAGNQILSSFDAALSEYAMKRFQRQRIEVRTGSQVVRVAAETITLADGSEIPYGMMVWSTGNGPTDLVAALPFARDPVGRLITDSHLRVCDTVDIYAMGDCMTMQGMNLAATAQVAQQQGGYLARALNQRARGQTPPPFRFKNKGMLAYIGGNQALADLPNVKGRGFTTWLFWRSVYITKLVSWKNKIAVAFDWFKTRLFGRDISQF
jgi:NADH:ubiquinone reductase (non-electrogenic)